MEQFQKDFEVFQRLLSLPCFRERYPEPAEYSPRRFTDGNFRGIADAEAPDYEAGFL